MDNLFKIDGIAIPAPTDYEYSEEDVSSENTGRTLDGVMHKDVVAVKDYYPCKWGRLSWEDAATLLNAVHGKTQVLFTHVDPKVPNRYVTDTFYIGKRTCRIKNLNNKIWSDVTMTFIKI